MASSSAASPSDIKYVLFHLARRVKRTRRRDRGEYAMMYMDMYGAYPSDSEDGGSDDDSDGSEDAMLDLLRGARPRPFPGGETEEVYYEVQVTRGINKRVRVCLVYCTSLVQGG